MGGPYSMHGNKQAQQRFKLEHFGVVGKTKL
jgi:hypothetical protein